MEEGINPKKSFQYQRSFIIITRKCLNDCLFCTEIEKRGWPEPTLEEIKNILISKCEPFSSVVFSGGEPSLRKDIFELIAYAKSLNYEVNLYSNGRLFSNPDIAKKAAEVGLDAVSVPLHGPNAEIHDKITQRPGSFKQTIVGIQNLSFYKIGVRIKIIPNKINYKYLPELAFLALSLPNNLICMDMLVIAGGALKNKNIISVRLSEMVPYIEKAIDILIKNGRNTEVASLPLCLLQPKYWKYINNGRIKEEIVVGGDRKEKSKVGTAGQVLTPVCRYCTIKDRCPGTWQPYFDIYGDSELKPML